MKTLSPKTWLPALAALSACFTTATHAQGWETVFTLPPPADGIADRAPRVILPDPFSTSPSTSWRLWIGMESDDHDLVIPDVATGTFSVQSFSVPPIYNANVARLGFDPSSQSLYALSRYGVWQVRKSSDQGASWTVVDSLPGSGNDSGHGPRGFARDDQGNLYVSGHLSDWGPQTWILRKSSDQGSTWTTVYQLSDARESRLIFVPGAKGGLFAAGYRFSSGYDEIWTVRRSRDGGATWKTVDTFLQSGRFTSATDITSDRQGRIYVAGSSSNASSNDPFRWELRVSENGGDSWKTASPPNATAQINGDLRGGIAVDLAGNLFLAGILDAWAVARRTADGVWQDIEYPLGGPEAGWVPSMASAISIDAVGNVFVAGTVRSGSPWPGTFTSSLVVQKLAATVRPPLVVKRFGNTLIVSWPAAVSGAQLESTDKLDPGAVWQNCATIPVVIGDEQAVTVDIGTGAHFYRLKKL